MGKKQTQAHVNTYLNLMIYNKIFTRGSKHVFCFVLFRWKAANYSQLYGMTLDEGIRFRLGTQRPSRTIMNMNEIQVQDSLHL